MLPVWLTDTVTPDLDRALHYTLLWGLEGVVLRTVGSRAERVPFVNEARLRRRLAEREVPVAALWPGLFEGDLADKATWLNELALLDEVGAFARRLACGLVVIGAFEAGAAPEVSAAALRRAGEVAAKQGVRLAVRASGTATRQAALLAEVAHPAVGAVWDPVAAAEAGERPAEGLAALREKVHMVVVRDHLDGAVVVPGDGEVDWHAQSAQLWQDGFTGPLCLELEGDAPAKRGLAYATAMLRWRQRTKS